jgi:hypothetical protein
MQVMAMEYIYEKVMRVPKQMIVRVKVDQLAHYEGETIILPVFSHIGESVGGMPINLRFSRNIIPVFISYVKFFRDITQSEVEYLKCYEPIGCRDRFTCDVLTKHKIRAYVNGCLTACLPKREFAVAKEKTFVVDCSQEIIDRIPSDKKANVMLASHIGRKPSDLSVRQFSELEKAKEVYCTYLNEASLVITSRLHCASPCMAAGIPVILSKGFTSCTMTWIDKYLYLYDREDYDNIDWNPRPVCYEDTKENVLKLVVTRIKCMFETFGCYSEVDQFYSSGVASYYSVSISRKISEIKNNKNERFTYSIYGNSGNVYSLIGFMNQNYPNATLTHIYDKYKYGDVINEIVVESIEKITDMNEFLIISVISPYISGEITDYLMKIGKPEGSFTTFDVIRVVEEEKNNKRMSYYEMD